MIKRILPFVLVFAVLLSFMVSPLRVKADTSSVGFDVLDFCTVNDSFSNRFTFTNSGTAVFDFSPLMGSVKAFNFEIYLTWTDVRPNSFTLTDGSRSYNVGVREISPSILCLYGSFRGYSVGRLSLSCSASGTSYIQFNKFWIDTTSSNRVDLGATITNNDGTSVTLSPGSSAAVDSLINTALFSVQIPFSYWSSLDYIDLSGIVSNCEISAISASVSNGAFIPISSSVMVDMPSRSFYCFSLRLDLTAGDLPSSGFLVIDFNCEAIQNSARFRVDSLCGLILSEGPDSQMTWYQLFWARMQRMIDTLSSGFSALESAISNNTSVVEEWFEALYNIVGSEFSTLRSLLTSSFSSLESAVSYNTERFESWFSWYVDFFRGFFDGFNTKLDTLISKIQELIDGQPVDESVTDGMQSAEDDLGNMTDQMDQSTPDISVDDVDVSTGWIPQDGSEGLSVGFFDIFWQSNYLVSMLTTVIAISMVSFVFFGKK